MGNCFKSSVSIIKEIENTDGLTDDEIKIIKEIENTDGLTDDEIKIIYRGMDKNCYSNMGTIEGYLELKNIINNVKHVKSKSDNNLILTNLEKEDYMMQNIYHYTFKDKNTTNITLILINTKNINLDNVF